MQFTNTRRQAAISGKNHLNLFRYQFLTGILFAAVIPYALRYFSLGPDESFDVLNKTFVAVIFAIGSGIWLLQNLNTYPGVEKTSHIISSFSVAFGIVFAVLLLGRIEYNRITLSFGYGVSCVWYYAASIVTARLSSFTIGTNPFSNVSAKHDFPGIKWVYFSDPKPLPHGIDAVTVDLREDLPEEWERAFADIALSGIRVLHTKHLIESLTGRVELEHISENNFGSLSPISAYMTAKYCVDRIAAVMGLIIISPLLIFCAAVIKLDSPGPALFRQRRVGYQGRPFTVYKLRSMRLTTSGEGGDARTAAMTTSGDARITRIGQFLRKSRLDELPQLINVAKGEMSFIGPRPEAEILSEWYEAEIPFYRYRHIIRPGITGWAQVNQGHVADVDNVKQKLHYDFYYIKNFSPWLDALIIGQTIRTMITGYGAR